MGDEFVHMHENGHTDDHATKFGCSSKSLLEPIAICGLALRLPGGIQDAKGFWNVLYNGKDTKTPIPSDRYNALGFNDSLGKKGAIKTKYGYFLTEDLSCLDASFFTMNQNELEKTDPQQRKFLEIARECLENAGETEYRGKVIGTYVGTFGEDWLLSLSKENQHYGGNGLSMDLMIANRVAYEYDLKGPSMVIKTGCSASLVALHEACRALERGDCTGAIVGGTSLIMGPTTTAAMAGEDLLSPEGSCKTFDASADGFARGEAINAVFIKRLVDAVRDKNPIRAVIRNTGTNSDGRSQGLMAPNGKAQEALIRKVYLDAGLDPWKTAFVECHGTGTTTGDPIEANAVGNVFGERGVYIGSVKPNVGHSEGASGLSSLIKATLSLENKVIPPNIKFVSPNPKIPFQDKQLKVPLQATAWPSDRAERISINSFGIGGSNAHVVLDSAAAFQQLFAARDEVTGKAAKLLVFSANTQGSLQRLIDNYKEYFAIHPERLFDLSYTLALRREHLPHRAFAVVSGSFIANVSQLAKVSNPAPHLTMIFSGQGAQWPEMGKELMDNDANFREDIVAMDKILHSLEHSPNWTIENELRQPSTTSRLDRAEIAQPLCTALQIALFNCLTRCGIQSNAVIGHSSGEIAAAYATGALSMSEAITIAYYRGYVTTKLNLRGGMAAIGLDKSSTSEYLTNGVVIACENSPNSTTISGNLHELESIVERIKRERPDILARQLQVDMAYHSHHMQSLASEYLDLLQREFELRRRVRQDPRVPLYSSVIDGILDKSRMFGLEYWVSNLTSPVRFQSAVSNLLQEQPSTVFLEIGPHSTLGGPLRQICAETRNPYVYIPTMVRKLDCLESLLTAFGHLYQQGAMINFEAFAPEGRCLSDLPTYPWDHAASYWYESRVSKDWRFRKYGHHAILGQRVPESTTLDPCWRVVLNLEDETWLGDHKVQKDVVFPFAGYVAMAGEAIRQITGIEAGYSVRHVIAHTALVLSESKPIEVVTTLRRHKLTDSTDSEFYDFVISSYSGSVWIKNCEGRVKANETVIPTTTSLEALPRHVPVSRWYEILSRVGLNYGPEFQGLTEISSSATENLAAAKVSNSKACQEGPFLFHPAAIDACFQLAIVAMAKGAGRNFTQLCVPTMIEELDISRSALQMFAKAWISDDGKDIAIDCVAAGFIALRLRGMRVTPLDDSKNMVTSDRHAAARLEWCPDYDFMDVSTLFKPPMAGDKDKQLLEELSLLCILESAERLNGLSTELPHFIKFRAWLQREVSRAKSGAYPGIERSASYAQLSRAARCDMINAQFEKLSIKPSIKLVATGVMRICEHAEDLFTGRLETIDLLMRDNILIEIYNAISFGFGDFVRMLSNTKPNLRILEVGAGTGGTTELLLRDLVSSGGNPSYSIYTFTDISAGFFSKARERFAYASNMEYKVFDISQRPFEQGFQAASYDLILANNVVHATPSLQATLRNLQPLLRPHGHLVLSEVCAVARAPGYIFGNFSGWWLGESDGRMWEPYVMVDRWDRELKEAGFTGVDTAVYDGNEQYRYCAAIVTQTLSHQQQSENKSVAVLCDHPSDKYTTRLIDYLEQSGYTATAITLGDRLPFDHDIISTLDLEDYFFENITEARFCAFQDLLRGHHSQRILWLMPPTQVRCVNPRAAQTIGMFRTIRAELAIPLFTLEIDPAEPSFLDLVLGVFKKICSREDTENLAPDKEFVVDRGVVKIGRYQPFSVDQALHGKTSAGSGDVKTLEIVKPGLLETLQWVEGSLPGDLHEDFVEIETRAAGLNFRDVVFAMGVISFGDKVVPMGAELAGRVRRIGSNVRNVAVNDRVLAVACYGCFTTNAVVFAPLVARIPDDLSFEEAATIPGCFTTVMHALLDIGHLEKGQKVLIHSACGGVGHAAIQLCKMIGAEVYATVGNEEKVQYLIQSLGIPQDRIFNSRDTSFLPGLMRETGGRGVDIVLNSLSGELLHASWKCVAPFGKLIELGKRDLAEFGNLEMEPFLKNRAYCCVDIGHLIQERPDSVGRLLERCLSLIREGKIHPIQPMAVFEASDIQQAFRHLQKGDHIGKAVVSIPGDTGIIRSTHCTKSLKLNPDASYLLTGGLGGIGRSLATWMVEQGARYLTFLSRSAGLADDNKAFFEELRSMNCSVAVATGKVDNMGDLQKAISISPKPIKGVVHLAMVLRDNAVIEMTYSEWTSAIAPKVSGAWNLHNAFINHPLDFFIMTSSLVTLVDQPGQANYSAANTFLESFCQFRHNLNLPASVLAICPIDGVGFIAEKPAVRRKIKSLGLYFLAERELLDFFELAMLDGYPPRKFEGMADPYAPWKSHGHVIMGLRSEVHLDDPACLTSWRRDRRMGMYHNIPQNISSVDNSSDTSALKTFLARCADDPELLSEKTSAEYLAREIGKKIFVFMVKEETEVDIKMSLAAIGLDSLMAIEVRRWWKQVFGLEITILEIISSGTLEELGKMAANGCRRRLCGEDRN